MEEVVSPVDHKRFEPVANKIELPQPSVTVTTGADGADGSLSERFKVLDGQPLSNRKV